MPIINSNRDKAPSAIISVGIVGLMPITGRKEQARDLILERAAIIFWGQNPAKVKCTNDDEIGFDP